jgi:DNA-binding response OmpR family regulator
VPRQEGYQVVTTQFKKRGLINARSCLLILVILDVNPADGSGIELCKEIRAFDKQTPIVYYTAGVPPNHIE